MKNIVGVMMAAMSSKAKDTFYNYSSHNTWKPDFKGGIDQHKKNLSKKRKKKKK